MQVLAVVPGGAGGESQAVQVSAVVPGEQAGKVRQCRFWPSFTEEQAGKVRQCRFRPSFTENRRGKSGSTGFGQSPRRGRRGKSGSAGFGRLSRRAGGESQAVQVSAVVPREQARKVRRCRFRPSFPKSRRGKSVGLPEDSGGRPNQSFLPPKTINPAEIVASTIMMYLIFSANPQTWSYLNS